MFSGRSYHERRGHPAIASVAREGFFELMSEHALGSEGRPLRVAAIGSENPHRSLEVALAARDLHDNLLHRRNLFTEIEEELHNNKLDLGIVSTPLKNPTLMETPLYVEKFRIYLNPEHPAYGKKTLDIDDLLMDKVWLLSEGNCFRK